MSKHWKLIDDSGDILPVCLVMLCNVFFGIQWLFTSKWMGLCGHGECKCILFLKSGTCHLSNPICAQNNPRSLICNEIRHTISISLRLKRPRHTFRDSKNCIWNQSAHHINLWQCCGQCMVNDMLNKNIIAKVNILTNRRIFYGRYVVFAPSNLYDPECISLPLRSFVLVVLYQIRHCILHLPWTILHQTMDCHGCNA